VHTLFDVFRIIYRRYLLFTYWVSLNSEELLGLCSGSGGDQACV
jgi:hypothetical protein